MLCVGSERESAVGKFSASPYHRGPVDLSARTGSWFCSEAARGDGPACELRSRGGPCRGPGRAERGGKIHDRGRAGPPRRKNPLRGHSSLGRKESTVFRGTWLPARLLVAGFGAKAARRQRCVAPADSQLGETIPSVGKRAGKILRRAAATRRRIFPARFPTEGIVSPSWEIGRANVLTPVTSAYRMPSFGLKKKKHLIQ